MKRRKPIAQEATNPHITTLAKESDRGCVILVSSILDYHLTRIHEAFVTAHLTGVAKPKDFLDSLTNQFGPLNTFSGKIKLALAYGLIYIDEYEALEIVRKLRNEAAHENLTFSFEDKGIKKLIIALDWFNGKNAVDMSVTKDRFPELSDIKMMFIRCSYGLRLSLEDRYLDGMTAIQTKLEGKTS